MKITYLGNGLGDTIDNFTTATGIKTVVKAVAKAVTGDEDCGCDKRKEILNDMFPYNNNETKDS